MFSTLKYDAADKDSNFKLVDAGRSNRPQFSSRSQHSACQGCHSKKVKCSGQKSGCNRCRSKAFTCVYAKPKRQPKSPKSTSASTEPSFTKPPASSPSTNDAEVAAKPSCSTLQFDQTTSGQDLLPASQEFLDHELGAAADLQYPGPLNDFDGDAAFDALWNPYTSGANNGLEYEDNYMMRGGSSPLDPCAESSHQPMSSLNTASLQELIDSSHEPTTAHKDSPSREIGVDFSNVGPLCISASTSDWSSIFSNSTNRASRLRSGTPSTTGFPEKSPPQSLDAADSPTRNTVHPKIPNSRISDRLRSGTPSPTAFPGNSPLQSLETADSPDMNTLHPNIPNSPNSSSCQCMQTALRILEVLETDNNKFNNSAFDHILGLKKNAISQCSLMLGCQACSASSAFVVLLIVICEKILMSFESWSTRYQGRKPKVSDGSSKAEPSDRSKGKIRNFFLGVYEVDSEHEQCSLLRSLAMVQLRHLHRLLNRLQGFAASRKWATHQASLASFVLRLEGAAAGLIARESLKID